MPQENYQKIKLLKIMEILRQETDEELPMTKAELCDRLISMNISCNIRSLNRGIPLLNEQGYETSSRYFGSCANTCARNVLCSSPPESVSTDCLRCAAMPVFSRASSTMRSSSSQRLASTPGE